MAVTRACRLTSAWEGGMMFSNSPARCRVTKKKKKGAKAARIESPTTPVALLSERKGGGGEVCTNDLLVCF